MEWKEVDSGKTNVKRKSSNINSSTFGRKLMEEKFDDAAKSVELKKNFQAC
jgi:hypothetical protein